MKNIIVHILAGLAITLFSHAAAAQVKTGYNVEDAGSSGFIEGTIDDISGKFSFGLNSSNQLSLKTEFQGQITGNMDVNLEPVAIWADSMVSGSVFTTHDYHEITNVCLRTPPPRSGLSQPEWDRKYSSRFIYCMRGIIVDATGDILDAVADYMKPAFYAMIMLAFAIMGIKAIGGMFRNVKGEMAGFLVKVLFAFFLFNNMDGVAGLFFYFTDFILRLVGNGALAAFSTNSIPRCNFTMIGGENNAWLNVFDNLDCTIMQFIGVGLDGAMLTGFVSTLEALIFSGTFTLHLFFVLLAAIIGLLSFIFRTTFMIIMAYGALALLMMMLPLMVLMLFFKVTESVFLQRWLGYCVSNTVQAGIMVSFLFFALAGLDMLIYSGSPGVYYSFNTGNANEADESAISIGLFDYSSQITPATPGIPPFVAGTSTLRTGQGNLTDPTAVAAYEPAVVPMFAILGITKNANLETQVKQMMANFGSPEKLFTFELTYDPRFAEAIGDRFCGGVDDFELNKFKTGAGMAWLERKMPDWLPEIRKRLDFFVSQDTENINPLGTAATDVDELEQYMKDYVLTLKNPQEAMDKINILICSYADSQDGFFSPLMRDEVNNSISNYINNLIPEYQPFEPKSTVYFSKSPYNEANGVGTAGHLGVIDYNRMKLLTAVAALLLLAGTYYAFTNYIPQIARHITGRMGLGLSMKDPTVYGRQMLDRVGTGFVGMEEAMTKSIKNGDGFKAIGQGLTGFRSGIGG